MILFFIAIPVFPVVHMMFFFFALSVFLFHDIAALHFHDLDVGRGFDLGFFNFGRGCVFFVSENGWSDDQNSK